MACVRIVSETEPAPALPLEPALVTGYEPDRFQKFAIEAIEAGDDVLVTAKTGSGKTFVGEYQIAKSLQRGGRVFYTTPVKSLSNQKFHDLKELFPEASVGIMTGDIKFRPDAQIIVMTTEILRNLLFKTGGATEKVGMTALLSLENLDAVVFDEVHYINDMDRGHVWEETLMLLPCTVKLILLSATLSQPEGFADWLSKRRGVRLWLISTQWRAVPLEHYVRNWATGAWEMMYSPQEQFNADVVSKWLKQREEILLGHDKFKDKVRDARRAGVEGAIEGKTRLKSFEHQMNDVLEELGRKANLPAIFFVFSRAGCEALAGKVAGDFLDSSDSAKVAHIWDFHLSRYRALLEHSPQAHALRALAMRGIAYHHSGLLPFLKEILEVLFSKGLIKVLFATETFAVGINMPTKTVVFTALDKFSEGGIRPLRSSEYIQMAGRAGRRGKDTKGLVLYLPQRQPCDLPTMRSILTGRAASFESRMGFHYDFVLKMLLKGLKSDEIVRQTYWWNLLGKEVERSRKEWEVCHAQVESVACNLSDEQQRACEERLAIDAKIAQSQNAKKKAAVRELQKWEEDHPEKSWVSTLERYSKLAKLREECQVSRYAYEDMLARVEDVEKALPQIPLRVQILRECGYVDPDGALTERGLLASECNEGHSFLMESLFRRVRGERERSVPSLLSSLAVFLGERRAEDESFVPVEELKVDGLTRENLLDLRAEADRISRLEDRLGVSSGGEFWELRTEWVEPITTWISAGEDYSMPALASEFGLFEGNIQRALLKLMGLVEEFRVMCELSGEVEWLKELEGVEATVLRGVPIAESLYLRL